MRDYTQADVVTQDLVTNTHEYSMYILYTEPCWQYRLVTGGPLALFDQFFLLLSDGVDSDSLGEMVGGEGGGRVGGEEGGKEGRGEW